MLNPNDDALLNDLLDERLAPDEEAALAARLEREPALREAWDELVRAREVVREAPEAQPPADFVARVRARIDAAVSLESASLDAAPESPAAPAPAPDSDGAPRPLTALPPAPVPRAWRGVMTLAYAAAAALMLGIGLFAWKDSERAGTPASETANETTLARGERERRAEGDVSSVLAGADGKRKDGGAKAPESRWNGRVEPQDDPRSTVPPPAAEAPRDDAKREDGLAVALGAEPGKPAGAGTPDAPTPAPGFAGPGGSVRPGLREPSDSPAAPAPTTPPAPSVMPPPAGPPPTSHKAPTSSPPVMPSRPESQPRGQPAPLPAPMERSAPRLEDDAYAGELLVLEATSLEAGRALLKSVTAGPGAPSAESGGSAGSAPGSTPGASTSVSLRRFDPRRDAPLLGALQRMESTMRKQAAPAAPVVPVAPPSGGAPAPSPAPLPPTSPAAPAAPAAAPPGTPAPAPAAAPVAAPKPTAEPAMEARQSGLAAGARVLGVEPLSLAPAEYQRLAALLGPAGASGPTDPLKKADKGAAGAEPKPDADAAQDAKTAEPSRRRVRVLIVRPSR